MELTYTNANGESVILRQTRPFFLTRVDGAGKVRQTVNTFKAPDQDGAIFISSAMDMRNITLEGSVITPTIAETYDQRRRFLRVFTPKLQGTLVYRNRQIACVVEEAGFTASSRERAPNFFISLLCPSPFFEALEEIREELAMWSPLLLFPLEIPIVGLEFGIRQPSQIITVDNIGDVACGCHIIFRALGSVTNPELMSLDNGDVLRLNTVILVRLVMNWDVIVLAPLGVELVVIRLVKHGDMHLGDAVHAGLEFVFRAVGPVVDVGGTGFLFAACLVLPHKIGSFRIWKEPDEAATANKKDEP